MVFLTVLSSVLSLYFAVITVLELMRGSYFNAFVLATISATYAKGFFTKRWSYPLVASLIASAFSLLMIASFVASGEFSFATLGIVAVPVYAYLHRR